MSTILKSNDLKAVRFFSVIAGTFLTMFGLSFAVFLAILQINNADIAIMMFVPLIIVSALYLVGIAITLANALLDTEAHCYYNSPAKILLILVADFFLPLTAPLWVIAYMLAIGLTKNDLVAKLRKSKVTWQYYWFMRLTRLFVELNNALLFGCKAPFS